MIRPLLLLIAALLGVPATAAGPLVIAAASLQEALGDAASVWASAGHERPVLSFAASSTLARQVAAGAPADLFLSADQEWMDVLDRARLLRPGTRATLLTNRLVLVAPATRPRRLAIGRGAPLVAALGPNGRLAMADPDSVPAGRYARTALERLGLWREAAPRVVRGESVRAALALVERGAAPLGIVYATDARVSRGVMVAGMFPAASHPPITYPLARLARSTHAEAEPFRRFLMSPRGRAIFAAHGFGTR